MSLTNIINYAKFTLTSDPAAYVGLKQPYTPNKTEKVGNVLLWPAKNLPSKTYELAKSAYKKAEAMAHDPVLITAGLTVTAMTAVQFAFYPEATKEGCKLALDHVIKPAGEFAWNHAIKPLVENFPYKFVPWLLIEASIAGWGTRSIGRFQNPELRSALEGMQPKTTYKFVFGQKGQNKAA